MKNIEFKKLLPHITAVAVFIIISLVYFYPLIEGYKLKQGDIEKHKAMAHEFQSHKEKHGDLALWSGNMFGGMPTYLTSNVKYNGSIGSIINKVYKLWLPHPAGTLFAYFLGFYILLLCLKINPWLSIVGAIGFAFSSYFFIILEAGHTSKAYAIGYMAPILGGFIITLRGQVKLGFILIAVFTAAQVYVNHLQISFYLFIILLTVWVFELIHFMQSKEMKVFLRRTAFVVLAGILGVLPNLGPLLITYEYSKVSTRGGSEISVSPNGQEEQNVIGSGLSKEYITQWSYGIDETWTLLSPNVKGGSSIPILGREKELEQIKAENPLFFNVIVEEYQKKRNAVKGYFGNQPIVSGPVYIGGLLILLAILALFFVKERLIRGLAVVSILAIFLSWGKNLMPLTSFFIDYIPGYNKFRAVAMILVIVELTVPIMAILFIDYFIKNIEEIKKQQKKLFIIIGSVVTLMLLFYLSPSTFVDLTSNSEEAIFSKRAVEQGVNYNLEGELISYRESVVSTSIWYSLKFILLGSLFILLFLFGKIKRNILVLGLGVFILIDLWIVNKDYLNNEKATNASGRVTNNYAGWIKTDEFKVPFVPSATDQQILQNEVNTNPEIDKNIKQRIADLKQESPRLEKRKLIDVQYSELMEATHYRVLNSMARLDQDARTPYFHKTLGGYHGAKIRRYQDIADFYLALEHYQIKQILGQGGNQLLSQYLPSMKTVNMLNAKYIIGPGQNGSEQLFLNPNALGNVWLVDNYKIVENADSAILGLKNLNISSEILVERSDSELLSDQPIFSKSGSIKLDNYEPNQLTYSYNLPQEQLVVFSEIYYDKGWQAYINDEPVPHFRANYLLRAMRVPAGIGNIEFKFEPKSYIIGKYITWVSTLFIFLLIVGYFYTELKANKEN
jgi:hypothetical protein